MVSTMKKFYHFLIGIPRRMYYKKLRTRLTNETPTIISSDCFGGIASNNLGLKFKSPTVNLYLIPEEFIVFVKYLRGFLAAEMVEVNDSTVSFPVGELTYDDHKVRIYFMHYKDFESAKKKWDERKQRVDYSNLYVVLLSVNASKELIESFEELAYANKMLITKENPTNSKVIKTHPVLSKTDYQSGEFLRFKSAFSFHRYMDEIDYVSFLNRKS